MPVLPFLEDRAEHVRAVVEPPADAGAQFIYPAFGVTMRQGQREHFLRELDRAFPGENLSRRYLARYGDRYRCPSPRARELWGSLLPVAGKGVCSIRCPTLSRRPPGGMGTGS